MCVLSPHVSNVTGKGFLYHVINGDRSESPQRDNRNSTGDVGDSPKKSVCGLLFCY